MQGNKFLVYFILFLTFYSVHPSVLTNLCPASSCNCTLTNNINLDIVCDLTANAYTLPTLINGTLQASVTELHISSSIAGTHGPLKTLPTNICLSYPNIAILDLSSNAITGFLNTSELACLGSNLLTVDISNNYINNIETNFFRSNNRIQSINLSQNNLTTMPMIDGQMFVNFPSTVTLMNFSYNQIINADFWPLFVRTGSSMTIDLSNNLIINITNNVPISVNQFTQTPDPRTLYLNNNQIERISDLVLEQYGACSTLSRISTAYFVVGISNMLLTNNSLICDCQSYYLVSYINDNIYDFPQIYNGSALITQATCASPSSTVGEKYIYSNFSQSNACNNYILPNITDIFCSVYTNETTVTLPPPTYWPTSTTILTTITTGIGATSSSNGGGNGGSGSNSGSGSNASNSSNSSSPSWYIILGIVLGLVLMIFLIALGIFLCKDRLLPGKCRSQLLNNNNNPNKSYEPMKGRRLSMSTSTGGVDDQDNRMLQLDRTGMHSNRTSNGWSDRIHPEQETQTCFQVIRSKPPTVPPRLIRDRPRIPKTNTDENSHHDRKLSSSTSTDVATNTTGVIKGIPISSVTAKIPPVFPNGNDTLPDTSTSELSVTSIPLAPSKRAKLLPPVKSGVYMDSTNKNLLNTSASSQIANQRQRRRSLMWSRKQQQNIISSPLVRPQSMTTRKTSFNDDDSFTADISSIPTVESFPHKPSKPLRALPLLNITVISAWMNDDIDQK